jgi:hypothetical protein
MGDDNGSNGYGNKGGGQAMMTMAMVAVTNCAMAMAMRWWVKKRVMTTAARAMKTVTKRAMVLAARAMRMATERAKATDGEGNGNGGKM